MIDCQKSFKLGNICVEPLNDQLSCEQKQLEIQSMAMKVLCYFASNQGELITRDNLREHVWKNATTSDHTINNHIYSLRRTITQLDPDTKYIHTVTGSNGKGYRLLATTSQSCLSPKESVIEETITSEIDSYTPAPLLTENELQKKSFNKIALLGIFVVLTALVSYLFLTSSKLYDSVSPLSFQEGREHNPAISQDGKIIIFSHRDKRKTNSSRWALFASYLNSPKESHRLFDISSDNDNYVSISSNNKYITFLRSKQGQKGIYIADFNDKKLIAKNAKKIIELTTANLSPAISWLNDSQFFYSAQETTRAPLRIYLYDLALDRSEQITSPPVNTFGDMAAVVSPDKQKLAIMRADGDNGYQLNLLNLANKNLAKTPIKIAENRLNISFSDNSKSIFYVDAQGFLASYDIDSQNSEIISSQPYLGYWPLKVPGKDQFIMQQEWSLSSLTTQIVRFNNPQKGGDGLSKVVVNNGLSIRAIEGINNNGIIFASVKPNHHIELWRFKEGKANKLDEFNEKPEYRYPLSLNWLKGSNNALLSINKSCRLINIDTGKDSPLCPADENVYAGRFSLDGQNIFFPANKQGMASAVKMGKTGYPFDKFTALANANLIVQTSTEDFYYSEYTGFDIYHYNSMSQKHTKLVDRTYLYHGYSINDFIITDEGIYFMDRIKVTENAIYFYDFKSKKRHFLIDSKDNYPNIVLSDDQQYIYLIESVDNDSKLLLIE